MFVFLQFAHINLLQTVAYTLLTLVLGCFLWNNLARQAVHLAPHAAFACATGALMTLRLRAVAYWPPAGPACSFTHRPPVPVPLVLREGIKASDAKDVAEKATVQINKGLGERAAPARRLCCQIGALRAWFGCTMCALCTTLIPANWHAASNLPLATKLDQPCGICPC